MAQCTALIHGSKSVTHLHLTPTAPSRIVDPSAREHWSRKRWPFKTKRKSRKPSEVLRAAASKLSETDKAIAELSKQAADASAALAKIAAATSVLSAGVSKEVLTASAALATLKEAKVPVTITMKAGGFGASTAPPTTPGVTQLAPPNDFTVDVLEAGANNRLTAAIAGGATEIRFEKSLNGGVYGGPGNFWTEADGTVDDGGLGLGVSRMYRARREAALDPTKSASEWVYRGPFLTSVASYEWPTVAAAVRSLIPGWAAWRGLASHWGFAVPAPGAPTIHLFMNSLSNSKTSNQTGGTATNGFTAVGGGRVRQYFCNYADGFEITQLNVNALGGANGSRVIMWIIRSGSITFNRDLEARYGSGMSIVGETCPFPGLQIRHTNHRLMNDDQICSAIHFYHGTNGNPNPSGNNGDGAQVGGALESGVYIKNSGYLNCLRAKARDESFEMFTESEDCFDIQGVNLAPLHASGRPDGQDHACGTVGGEFVKLMFLGRPIQHGMQFRGPVYSRAEDNLVYEGYTYNSQKSDTVYWNDWATFDRNNHPSGTKVQRIQFICHGWVSGPGTVDFGPINISGYMGAFNSASRMWAEGCWLFGNGVAEQTNGTDTSWGIDTTNWLNLVREQSGGPFLSGSKTSGANAAFYATSRIAALFPTGMTPLAQPVTKAQKIAAVDLHNRTCGPNPAYRSNPGYTGFEVQDFQEVLNSMNGVTSGVGQGKRYNTSADRAYPTFADNTRDIFNVADSHQFPVNPDATLTTNGHTITESAKYWIEEIKLRALVPQPSVLDA